MPPVAFPCLKAEATSICPSVTHHGRRPQFIEQTARRIFDFRVSQAGLSAGSFVKLHDAAGVVSKRQKEKFNVDDVVDTFEISSMSKSSAIFDQQKLDWISGQYMREADLERLTDLAIPHLQAAGFVSTDNSKTDRNRVKSIVDAVRGQHSLYVPNSPGSGYFFQGRSC